MTADQGQFQRFWLAALLAAVGDQFFIVALPWLVLQVTGSGVALGAVLTLAALPRAGLMLVGGALSDRGDPRALLLAGSVARAALTGTVAALVYFDAAKVWQLYVLALAFGALDGLSYPATATLVPSLVDQTRLASANSRIQSTTQFAAMAVPAIAGALIASWGAAACFAVSAVTRVVATVFYAAMGAPRAQTATSMETTTAAADTTPSTLEVLRRLWADPAMRAFLILITAIGLAVIGPVTVGAPALAAERFGGSVGYGLMLSAAGGGTLAGTLIGGARRQVRRRGRILLTVNIAVGVLLMTVGAAQHIWIAIAAIALMSAGSGFVNLVATTTLQAGVDRTIRGRLMSVIMLASAGLAPLSTVLAGFLVDRDPALLFTIAGALVLLITGFSALSKPLRTVD